MKKIAAKISSCFLIVILMLQIITPAFSIFVNAETIIKDEMNTSIENDLSNVDLSNYPVNPLGECEIISFMEYCYSYQNQYKNCYGIYIYIYNPTCQFIERISTRNNVSMRIGDESAEFNKYYLEYMDRTDDGLFYKFKLKESTDILVKARNYALSHDDKRRYEIAELNIDHGAQKFESVNVSNIYEWSGFGAGLGNDNFDTSTLRCVNYGSRSIHLTLKHTNYRFAEKDDVRDELNSVFFSIPREYFYEFGNLNSVRAEWYEYKTNPIYITSDSGAYNGLWGMRGVTINEFGQLKNGYHSNCYWRVFWDETKETMGGAAGTPGYHYTKYYFGQTYNGKCRDDIDETGSYSFGTYAGNKDSWRYEKRLDWLFYVENISGADAYCVSKDEVKKYMEDYTKDFPNQSLVQGKYAKNLFANSIDSDRIAFLEDSSATRGHVVMDFYVDSASNQGNSFVDANASQGSWNKFWYGTDYETVTYSPIRVIHENDLLRGKDSFSFEFYVNINDVDDIKSSAEEAYANGEIPVLLRFAVTDYYASVARFDYAEENRVDMSDQDGYVAQETVFLDFDVISLGFKSANGYEETIIGVVADPIDIINGLTPPEELTEDEDSWWKEIMMILLLVILIVVFVFFVGPFGSLIRFIWNGIKNIISFIISLISLPFRFIGKLFKNTRDRS